MTWPKQTCRWCGIRHSTRVAAPYYLCPNCQGVDRRAVPDDRDGLPPGIWVNLRGISVWVPFEPVLCGTRAGYQAHLERRERTCRACRDAVRPQKYGPRQTLLPCGTHAAFNRHKKGGEDPCTKCREAERIYQTTRRRKPKNQVAA